MPIFKRFIGFSVICVALAASSASAATPSISVERNPSAWEVGMNEGVTWSTQNATKVKYSCTGPFSGRGFLTASGTIADTFKAEWIGTTTCVWTAVAEDGTESAPVTDEFTVKPASSGTWEFKIADINGQSYSPDSPVSIPSGTKKFTFRGTGIPGGYVHIHKQSNGDYGLTGQVPIDSNGQWQADFDYEFLSGIQYVSVYTGKPYVSGSERLEIVALNVGSSMEIGQRPTDIQCIAVSKSDAGSNVWVTTFNTSVDFWQSVDCSVTTSDPDTKAWLQAVSSHRGTQESSVLIDEPAVQVMGSYFQGSYRVRITSDYHGYALYKNLWFENSAGKSSQISILFRDPNSQEYKDMDAKYSQWRNRTSPAYQNRTPAPVAQINGSQGRPTRTLASSASGSAVSWTIVQDLPFMVSQIQGIYVSGKTVWRGLKKGVTLEGGDGTMTVHGLPASFARFVFIASGKAPAGNTITITSDRHSKVIRTEALQSSGNRNWWADRSSVADNISRAATRSFYLPGTNVITFTSADQSGNVTGIFKVILEIGTTATR